MEGDNPFTKSQTIDPEVRAYVYSLVNALGGASAGDDGRYLLGDDALAVLRDLKRWLKLYDEKHNRLDVARCLAEANIVKGDLLPILATWKEDEKVDRARSRIALACLETIVPLTWPLGTEDMTVNHHRHTPYIQQAQVRYKAAILHCNSTTILRQAIRTALPAIAMPKTERGARDEGIIKLMLYFLRNIAVIRQIGNLPSQGLETEISRSATIEAFREQDVFALLLTMCSTMGEDFNLQDVIILEILFALTKGVDSEKLWMTESQRVKSEVSDLKATLLTEQGMHRDAKKKEWSRHGRFGTMIWVKREDKQMSAVSGQDNLKDKKTALFNMDSSKKWNKPLQRRKDLEHDMHDFDHTENLTVSASEKLRNFVEEFLDSGFNPLFAHLRKAIEREAERLLPVNYRQFFYTVSWFLRAGRLRRQTREKKNVAERLKDLEPESYSGVAAVLNQETFIMLNRYMQISLDEKSWQDLNASMRCFTQILLTVQDMAQSPLAEDQDIAENIQNRIFYEETTHDRIVGILKGYKDQGVGYLDACTELSHVFLRLLERYSKENANLQIRSKRKARKQNRHAKNQQPGEAQGDRQDGDDDSETEDVVDAVQVTKERKFDFQRFAAKFVSQSSVNTFATLLGFYKDLSDDQLKRIHRFFYRTAFKQDMAVLLYRVDIVALFYRLIEGPEGLSTKHPLFGDWSEFSKQLFRKMFKKIAERPELMVEMLFSKINQTLHYLEYGHEKQTSSTLARAPAALEIKPAPGRDRAEQIGIVVSLLVKDQKTGLVTWLDDVVRRAFDERHAWEAEAEARQSAAEAEAGDDNNDSNTEGLQMDLSTGEPSYITVRPNDVDTRTAMFKDAKFRLLTSLVGLEALEADDSSDATWIIPSKWPASHLRESRDAMEKYLATPWQPENEDDRAEDMIRRARKQPQPQARSGEPDVEDGDAAPRDAFIDDSEGNDDVEEFMFPDNVRSHPRKKKRNMVEELQKRRQLKRKRGEDDNEDGIGDDEVDDELAANRKEKRLQAALDRRRKIKSELFIRDSDDESDAERDAQFFRQEEEVRRRQEERVRRQMALASEAAAKRRATEKTQGKNKTGGAIAGSVAESSEDELADVLMEDQDDTAPSSQPQGLSDSDEDNGEGGGDEEPTPLSSPLPNHDDDGELALKEIAQGRATSRHVKSALVGKVRRDVVGDEDMGQDESSVRPIRQRRHRGGFVIEDEDEDE